MASSLATRHTAFIGIGSNLDNPLSQVTTAIANLAKLKHCTLRAQSRYYQSKAVSSKPQHDFINAVVQLTTLLTPIALLKELQQIERQQQRQRSYDWGPRSLDLDLLLYDRLTMVSPTLVIPHPRMLHRDFVLVPLADIDSHWLLPNGHKISQYLSLKTQQNLQELATS